ncbi:MAG: hypothetical protein ABSA11_16555 [Candidatus Bathyarchaeia archaeon]
MVNIRLANPNNEVAPKSPQNITKFYYDYSELVYSELSREVVQNYIEYIINKERIDTSKIMEIRIMRFPFGYSTTGMSDIEEKQRPPGITMGHYVSALGIIDIYPPEFHHDSQISWFKEHREAGYYFTLFEPLRTLIHELLRVRYLGDENTVDRLTDKYMRRFERNTFGGIIFSDRKPFWESLKRTEF